MTNDRPPHKRRLATTSLGENVVLADFGARRRVDTPNGDSSVQARRPIDPKSWAADALMETLAMEADSGRLARGRDYYRAGKVISVEIQSDSIRADVAGSQLEPFEVGAMFTVLPKRHREFVQAELLADPAHILSILSGNKPGQVVVDLLWSPPVFADWRCTCPDRSAMCKHMVAVGYAVAERLVADPQLVLRIKGLDVAEILARHGHARRGGLAALPERTPPRGGAKGRVVDEREMGARGDEERAGENRGMGAVSDSDGVNDSLVTRVDPQSFWSGGPRVSWQPLTRELGIEQGDGQALMAALRTVSFTAVDQLQAFHDLEKCYEALTEIDSLFDNGKANGAGMSAARDRDMNHDD